jgi:hypothetical protein
MAGEVGSALRVRPRRWSILAGVIAVLADAPIAARAADLPMPPAPVPPAKVPAFVPDKPWWRFFTDGEWYFEFGSGKEFWSNTDIHVSQPALGNNFTIYNVSGHDAPSGTGDAPQFNIRVGRFFNENWGVELNIDHSKYYTNIGQTARVSGTIGNAPAPASMLLSGTVFYEELHNGANHIMLDAVYRYPLIGQTNETGSLAAIGKAGVGVMLPHTSDVILGNPVDVGPKTFGNLVGLSSGWWQLNGWTTGVEVGLRYVVFRPFYLELTNKVAYSGFFNLPAFQGTMSQSLWMDEIVLTFGFTYDGTSAHPVW